MAADQASVHIVHLQKTDPQPDSLEAHHLDVLSSVCGSHEKAKEAILYSYKNTVNGFSAKLTPQEVAELSKKPGVVAVVAQGVKQLHDEGGPHKGGKVSGGHAV